MRAGPGDGVQPRRLTRRGAVAMAAALMSSLLFGVDGPVGARVPGTVANPCDDLSIAEGLELLDNYWSRSSTRFDDISCAHSSTLANESHEIA